MTAAPATMIHINLSSSRFDFARVHTSVPRHNLVHYSVSCATVSLRHAQDEDNNKESVGLCILLSIQALDGPLSTNKMIAHTSAIERAKPTYSQCKRYHIAPVLWRIVQIRIDGTSYNAFCMYATSKCSDSNI